MAHSISIKHLDYLLDPNLYAFMGIDTFGVLAILHFPTLLLNKDGETVIKSFLG